MRFDDHLSPKGLRIRAVKVASAIFCFLCNVDEFFVGLLVAAFVPVLEIYIQRRVWHNKVEFFEQLIICNFLQFHIGVAVEKCLSNDFTKRASVNIVEQGGAMINLAGANDVAQPTATPITEISMLFRTAKYTPPFPRERGCA